MGKVGFGVGRARCEVPQSYSKAMEQARRNMVLCEAYMEITLPVSV